MIMVPGAEARIFPGDVLGVIGTDDEIQALIPVVESDPGEVSATSPGDVRFTSVRLSETSPLIGKNIVTSRFRDTYESLLVAVQRDDDYMQPDVCCGWLEMSTGLQLLVNDISLYALKTILLKWK